MIVLEVFDIFVNFADWKIIIIKKMISNTYLKWIPQVLKIIEIFYKNAIEQIEWFFF